MAGTPAKKILEKSLEEIKAGNWKQGTWGAGVANGTCEIQFGCAMGMVSIYGGHYSPINYVYDSETGQTVHNFDLPEGYELVGPESPAAGDPPNGVVKAVNALFAALPKTQRASVEGYAKEYDDGFVDLYSKVNACIDYNDSPDCTKGKAQRWFARAIEKVGDVNAKKRTKV